MSFWAPLKTSGAARRPLVVALAGALALGGCGGDKNKGDPIQSSQAQRMISLLELADQNVADRKCKGADAKAREVLTVVNSLSPGVDKDVRQGLKDGVDRLRSLISSECERPQPTETTETTETDTTPTTTTETQPTTTETQPTDTHPTTTETQPTTTTTSTQTTPTTTGNGGTPPGQGAADGTGGANG